MPRQSDPTFRLKDAGERAIRDWLVDTLPDLGGPALVIYEDKKMPGLLQREQLSDVVVVATTRAVLGFAEDRGLVASAEDAWSNIIARAAGANPSLNVRIMQPKS